MDDQAYNSYSTLIWDGGREESMGNAQYSPMPGYPAEATVEEEKKLPEGYDLSLGENKSKHATT